MRIFVKVLTGIVVAFGAVAALSVAVASTETGAHLRAFVQGINTGQASPAKKGHVDFIAEGQSIAANSPGTVKLHFRVDPGFHINSHTPKSDMLIPTKILIEDMNGANVSEVTFPEGTPYAFAFEPKQKLDVYTGDVTLTAHVKAAPGSYTMRAALHYQACDQAACYPPKTLTLEQPFTAK
jgi:DsbC/DsbD-like thiol-disulfide interchange protein